MKSILTMALSACLGLALGLGLGHFAFQEDELEAHRAKVQAYREWIEDPGKAVKSAGKELIFYEMPDDHWPSLHLLAAAGELEKAELIFPTVPYTPEAVRRWMDFCEEHRDVIIDAEASPAPTRFATAGEHPFNCTVFYLPGQDDVIRQLILRMEGDDPSGSNAP